MSGNDNKPRSTGHHFGDHLGDHSHASAGSLAPAVLIRCAADGELSPEQARALAEHLAAHPGDQARIEFERGLRGACSQAMGAVACPEALRTKVLAIAANATSQQDQESASSSGPTVGGSQTRDRSFWAGGGVQRALGALAAAAVLLVSGGFLIQMARTAPSGVVQADAMLQRASFVAMEHRACEIDPSRLAKFTVTELDRAPGQLVDLLGTGATMPDLQAAGFVFKGSGRCQLPGGGRSAHIRLKSPPLPDGSGGCMVSLFMQAGATDGVDMEPGKAYQLTLPESQRSGREGVTPTIYAWQVGEVSYFLVAERQVMCDKVARSVGLEIVSSR